jgi:uncharacterized damage-inducible protein DinB
MDSTITAEFSGFLLRDLEGLQREIELFPDEETPWMTRPGVANSAANLALHVAGNIQHFIGLHMGGIPYTRNRDAEFNRRAGTRQEVIAELARAIDAVHDVLPRLSSEQLEALFDAHPAPVPLSTRRFLIHLCTHTSFHLGQAGYLRRIITGDPRSTNTVTAERLR